MSIEKQCEITETIEMLEIIKENIIKSDTHEAVKMTVIEDCKPSSCEFVIDTALRLLKDYAGILFF